MQIPLSSHVLTYFFLTLKRSHISRVSAFHSYFWFGS